MGFWKQKWKIEMGMWELRKSVKWVGGGRVWEGKRDKCFIGAVKVYGEGVHDNVLSLSYWVIFKNYYFSGFVNRMMIWYNMDHLLYKMKGWD